MLALGIALSTLALAPGWPVAEAPAWTLAAAAAAVLASLTLATFVPARGSGRFLELGCGSCAAMAGIVPIGALWYLATSPVSTGAALLALAATGFALVKRLTDPRVCQTL